MLCYTFFSFVLQTSTYEYTFKSKYTNFTTMKRHRFKLFNIKIFFLRNKFCFDFCGQHLRHIFFCFHLRFFRLSILSIYCFPALLFALAVTLVTLLLFFFCIFSLRDCNLQLLVVCRCWCCCCWLVVGNGWLLGWLVGWLYGWLLFVATRCVLSFDMSRLSSLKLIQHNTVARVCTLLL